VECGTDNETSDGIKNAYRAVCYLQSEISRDLFREIISNITSQARLSTNIMIFDRIIEKV